MSKEYAGPPPTWALRSCSLDIEFGEHVAVVGPSGSGKTTFLNIVGLLDRPSAGTFELEGFDTGSMTEAQRAGYRSQHVGFVFQSFHLVAYRTVEENVMLGQVYNATPPRDRVALARAALRSVGLEHKLWSLPSTLSGGEQQRVAIARAIVNRPTMLLCDEPTGNLDSENANTVMDILGSLNDSGLTLITITHNAEVARRCGRRISIRDGFVEQEQQ